MQFIQPLWPAYPEIFLLTAVCVILVADLFVKDENRIVTYGLTQAALAGTNIAVAAGREAVIEAAGAQADWTMAVGPPEGSRSPSYRGATRKSGSFPLDLRVNRTPWWPLRE